MIKCNECTLEKDESEYHKNDKARNGYNPKCKSCVTLRAKKAKEKPKPKPKTYEEKVQEKAQAFKENNAEIEKLKEEKKYERVAKVKKTSARRYKNTSDESLILWRTRARAKKQKLLFDLTIEDIIIPEFCPILGIPIYTSKDKNNSPSIDRIIPKYGYTKNNVQIISNRANKLKSNATPEELLLFAEWTLKFFKRKLQG